MNWTYRFVITNSWGASSVFQTYDNVAHIPPSPNEEYFLMSFFGFLVTVVTGYIQFVLNLMILFTIIIIPSLYFLGRLVSDAKVMNGNQYSRYQMVAFWVASASIVVGGDPGADYAPLDVPFSWQRAIKLPSLHPMSRDSDRRYACGIFTHSLCSFARSGRLCVMDRDCICSHGNRAHSDCKDARRITRCQLEDAARASS